MTDYSISETTAYLLAQVCKAHHRRAMGLLGQIELHPGQEMLLLRLWPQDGLAQSELVDSLCVQPATVTKMIDRMEKSGLVERRSDLQDQRISRVYLTSQGRALQQPVESLWAELERQTLAHFSLEERLLLHRLLMQVLQNLSD